MNLDNFKNIKIDINSLKNLSFEDVRNFINEQQVLALNIAIGLGALIVGMFVINMRFQEYTNLKLRMDELVVKEEPARNYEKILKKAQNFLEKVPSNLSEENLIPYLTEIADRHNITINELQPPYVRIEGFYREVRISLVCSVKDFRNALIFVNDLESSKYMLKVNSWVINPEKKEQEIDDPRAQPRFLMSLDISSMQLMENDNKN